MYLIINWLILIVRFVNDNWFKFFEEKEPAFSYLI